MRRNRELLYALLAMVLITVVYMAAITRLGAVPAAGNLFGHSLGIVGFVLMLMTETLYSWRKRSRRARWGRMSSWLRFHIVTGLVGPFMVMLHTSWKFHGLAGVVTAMAVVIVFSGFVGRYIYTAVPRTAEGLALEVGELEAQIASAQARLEQWLAAQPAASRAAASDLAAQSQVLPSASGAALVLGRPFLGRRSGRDARRERRRLRAEVGAAQSRELDGLLRQRHTLERQAASLVSARQLLAVWHSVHIPIGLVLFTAAFVHVGAALYYATLLK